MVCDNREVLRYVIFNSELEWTCLWNSSDHHMTPVSSIMHLFKMQAYWWSKLCGDRKDRCWLWCTDPPPIQILIILFTKSQHCEFYCSNADMGWHIYLLLPSSHCILHIDGVWHSKKQSRYDDSMACMYGDCHPLSAGIWTLAAWRVLYICKFLYYVLVLRSMLCVFRMRINVHDALYRLLSLTAVFCYCCYCVAYVGSWLKGLC